MKGVPQGNLMSGTKEPCTAVQRGPENCDYLVIGCGIAGAITALKLASHGQVGVAAKGQLSESNSIYAQAGIATVLDAKDSFEAHVADTLQAGAGLCHPEVVKRVVEAGPQPV